MSESTERRDQGHERRLVLSPAMVLDAPGADLFADGLQERLRHCSDYFQPMTIVGLYVDDVPIGTGNLLTPDLRTQLLARCKTLIQRSVRSQPNDRRKITDGVFRLDPLFVAVLCNADRNSHLIPVGRIIEALRQASMINEVGGRGAFRRRVIVGSVTWDPRSGMATQQELVEKMVEAVLEASIRPDKDGYTRLRIGQSLNDDVLYHDHPWGEVKAKPVEAIARSATAPVAGTRAPSGPISGRTGPIVRSASGPIKTAEDPKKPFWRFW